jgi:hypothetical protein
MRPEFARSMQLAKRRIPCAIHDVVSQPQRVLQRHEVNRGFEINGANGR